MKRKDLLRHLEKQGCLFLREGANHTIYFYPLTKRTSSIPRHKDIDDFLSRKICRDLGVKAPGK